LLCALGFQARLQSMESAATPENKIVAFAHVSTQRGTVAELAARNFHPFGRSPVVSTQPLKRALDIFPFLAPSTLWELHLEMQEPAIESRGGRREAQLAGLVRRAHGQQGGTRRGAQGVVT
jgi:hypothetical protein